MNFLENVARSLEAGKLADIIFLDQNLFEIPESEFGEAKIFLALFEGREVDRHTDL